MTIAPYVSWFGEVSVTLSNSGGKGASLSRMYQAGFPVPPGYIVTTDAYRRFVQENGLQEALIDLGRSHGGTSDARLTAIRQSFARGAMPVAIEEAITQAARDLRLRRAGLPLVVRSSATAEDQLGASFAGQLHSSLNVRGDTALLEAVQRSWSSLWTARVLGYCARQGVDPSAIDLAVVVQVMVPAQASGVMFTANPVSGEGGEIAIDGAWGLGEAIVGGLVTPDHVVVNRATEVVKQMIIADKAVMTAPAAIGTRERAVEQVRRHAQVLDSPKAIELARLGTQIEGLFGTPQDIEWCLAGDVLHCAGETHHDAALGVGAVDDSYSWREMDQRPPDGGMGNRTPVAARSNDNLRFHDERAAAEAPDAAPPLASPDQWLALCPGRLPIPLAHRGTGGPAVEPGRRQGGWAQAGAAALAVTPQRAQHLRRGEPSRVLGRAIVRSRGSNT